MSELTDRLYAIANRVEADKAHFSTGNAIQLDDSKDRDFLLGLVREQAAKLAKVEDLIGWLDAASADDEPLYAKGKVSARATAKMLRDAIGGRA